MAQIFTNALDNANLTGSDEERAIRAREPDTTGSVLPEEDKPKA